MEPAGHPPSSIDSPTEVENPLSPSAPIGSTLQSSCCSVVRAEDIGSGGPRDMCGEGKGVSLFGTGAVEITQRSPRPSAFPSSQAWDSDSEKETLDEEELQHFSNPHGLAAHSPGPPLRSPSSGHRQERSESEVDQAPERIQHLMPEDDTPCALGVWDQGRASTQHDEPKMVQLSSPDSEGKCNRGRASTMSAELLLPENKPKEGRRNRVGSKEKPKRKEEGAGLDVYTFPGDSDPESPPLAPWAHCTFTQRRRRKRALLRPFSGLGSQQHAVLGPGRRHNRKEGLGPGLLRGTSKAKEEQQDADAVGEPLREEVVEKKVEGGDILCQEVFTCVECSIYFKKQVHLQEHMQQHCQSGKLRERAGDIEDGGFLCPECGWELEDSSTLAEHIRQHQESRRKILLEISKLNKDSRGVGEQTGLDVTHKRRGGFGGAPHSSRGFRGFASPLPGDSCDFQETSQVPPIQPAVWDEGQQEEHSPGTNQEFLRLVHPEEVSGQQSLPQAAATSFMARVSAKAGVSPKGGPHPCLLQMSQALPSSIAARPCRRDVAFKSLGNRRRGRRGVELAGLGASSSGCNALPLESGEAQKQNKILDLGDQSTCHGTSHPGGLWPRISTVQLPGEADIANILLFLYNCMLHEMEATDPWH